MNIVTQDQIIALLNSPEQFCIDFDDAWKWLEYSTKQKARNRLVNNFEEGIDYTLTQMVKRVDGNRGGGSTRYESIQLTVECLKSFAMMAGTAQGKEVRKYFLKCEQELKNILATPQPESPQPHILMPSAEEVEWMRSRQWETDEIERWVNR